MVKKKKSIQIVAFHIDLIRELILRKKILNVRFIGRRKSESHIQFGEAKVSKKKNEMKDIDSAAVIVRDMNITP